MAVHPDMTLQGGCPPDLTPVRTAFKSNMGGVKKITYSICADQTQINNLGSLLLSGSDGRRAYRAPKTFSLALANLFLVVCFLCFIESGDEKARSERYSKRGRGKLREASEKAHRSIS